MVVLSEVVIRGETVPHLDGVVDLSPSNGIGHIQKYTDRRGGNPVGAIVVAGNLVATYRPPWPPPTVESVNAGDTSSAVEVRWGITDRSFECKYSIAATHWYAFDGRFCTVTAGYRRIRLVTREMLARYSNGLITADLVGNVRAMASLRKLREELRDDSFRFAILAGLATIPFTVALSWDSVSSEGIVLGGSISGEALLLAGVIVGYRYSGRETESSRAGMWTGLVGSVGTAIITVATTITTIGTVSSRLAVIIGVSTPILIAIGVGLTVLVVMVSASVVGWVTKRLDRERRVSGPRDAASQNTAESKWWKLVAVYVVAAPIVLGATFWVRPDSGIGLGISAVSMIGVVLLSYVTVVALFVDVTAPRDANTDWIPNVWFYVGVPLAAYGFVYLAVTLWSSAPPSAVGVYGFAIALCFTSAIYLLNRQRHVSML